MFQIRVGFQLSSGLIVGLVRLIHEEKNGWVNWRGGWASSQFFAAMTWASTSFVGFSFLSSAMKESSTSLGFRFLGTELVASASFLVWSHHTGLHLSLTITLLGFPDLGVCLAHWLPSRRSYRGRLWLSVIHIGNRRRCLGRPSLQPF